MNGTTLDALKKHIGERIDIVGCHGTLYLTNEWLSDHVRKSSSELKWLQERGWKCDCEVVQYADTDLRLALRAVLEEPLDPFGMCPANVNRAVSALRSDYNRRGELILEASWDPSFQRGPWGIQRGARVILESGEVADRGRMLLVKDADGCRLGMIHHLLFLTFLELVHYDVFAFALAQCFGRSQHTAEIIYVSPHVSKDEHGFAVRVLDVPIWLDQQ